MQSAAVRGVKLVYEVLGQNGNSVGPWVAVSPGGRRGLAPDRALGVLLAEAGFRVLVYDRRNTGASEVGFAGDSESHEQAEDLLALLHTLGTGPAYVAGCSSGSRLSLLLALHHPEAVKALLSGVSPVAPLPPSGSPSITMSSSSPRPSRAGSTRWSEPNISPPWSRPTRPTGRSSRGWAPRHSWRR